MKKQALLFALLVLTVFGARSQRFEWAKGYGSSQEGCEIRGSVTDADGNLYILGQFRNDASWDGQLLLPMASYGPAPYTINTIIAKISPDGEMLWKKVIHTNNGGNTIPHDIKKMGDTAFACMVHMNFPGISWYTYYLDTLLPARSDYFADVSGQNLGYTFRTAFIVFDFDGNVKEQHFLYLTYVDNDGNDIFIHNSIYYDNRPLSGPSFDFDSEGNVYLCRLASDYLNDSYATQYGTISAVKYWVDGNLVATTEVVNKPLFCFPHLLKFSPHFSSLLASRYIFQSSDSINYSAEAFIRTDKDNNIFLIGRLQVNGDGHENTIVIDSLHNIAFSHPERVSNKGYLLNLDSDLNVKYLITLDDSVINPTIPIKVPFYDITFDYDSNIFFLSATCNHNVFGDTVSINSISVYNGIPLNVKNDAIVMAFSMSDSNPELLSYVRVPSIFASHCHTTSIGNLACANNRVFLQSEYYGGIHLPGNTIRNNNWRPGLIVFDYNLNIIDGIDYNAPTPDNQVGSIVLADSALYLINKLGTSATFGDIPFTVPSGGRYACIAKYVDTSFMTPYVAPPHTGIAKADTPAFLIYPNPTTGSLTIDNGSEPVVDAAVISLTGIKAARLLNGSTIDVSNLKDGIYILEVTTPSTKYYQKFIKM